MWHFAFIESIYIFYVYNIFKTKVSIHHPFEIYLQNSTVAEYLQHPIYTSQYESKICPFGKLVSKILILWIIIRTYLTFYYKELRNELHKFNKAIFWTIFIGSIVLNLNAFVYLVPVFIYEFNT